MTDAAAFIPAVRRYADAYYTQGGWDYIVEAYTDEELLEVIQGARSAADAIRLARKVARLHRAVEEDRRGMDGNW